MIIRWRSSYVATAQSRLVVTRFQKLEKHLNTHDRKQFVCTFKNCTVDKSTKEELWQHIRDHHQKRKYECSECPMSYDILSRLKAHCVGSHSLENQTLFWCKIQKCPVFKTTEALLYKHVREEHTVQTPDLGGEVCRNRINIIASELTEMRM